MDKTNKENTAEEARQNWHIIEMQYIWKMRRKMAKRIAADSIAAFKADKEKQIKRLNEEHEARKAAIEKAFDAQVLQVEQDLEDTLRCVAVDQDGYMHRFRNYVATLPKDEQQAYNTREDRE